ncbi:MAG TPA: prolyl oligopeptidase family serine peptidase [Puia sp.]|nr:prolyl oligopeptidase family serine peptidase [Puia sp.]
MRNAIFITLLSLSFIVNAQDDAGYKLPPKDIADMLLAKPTPDVSIDSKGDWMLLIQRNSYPSVTELAQPELRIAGLRINPNNFARSRQNFLVNDLSLENLHTGEMYQITNLPSPMLASAITWSPSENKVAFVNTGPVNVDLYVIDIKTRKADKINKKPLNTVLGGSFLWLDDQTLLYKTALQPASAAPPKPLLPNGPAIQENLGKSAPSFTYEDLLRTPYDELLFAFYSTAQLVSNRSGVEAPIGKPAIYSLLDLSPDKNFLLQLIIHKPFSYLVPASGFNTIVNITDLDGKVIKNLADLPSTETRPSGFDNVQDIPLYYRWRDDEPATITWCKALDSGLIRNKMEYHDAVYALSAPFTGAAKMLFKTKMRFYGVVWGNDHLALIKEGLNGKQRIKTSLYNPTSGDVEMLFERNYTDAYDDPGDPVLVKNKFARRVIQITDNGAGILMNNREGSSPKGDLPFLAKFNLGTKQNEIIWRCREGNYETVAEVLDANKLILLTRKESLREVPNYFVLNLGERIAEKPVTHFANPYPQLEGVSKQKIFYKRTDGVNLTGDLYLPKDYDAKRDGPLPVFIMAYPAEYNSANDAAQVRGSKNRFPFIYWGSPVFWVTKGYAILDDAEMPIVASDTARKPNDDFVNQLRMNAEAAIHKLAELGVGDSNRVAVSGHSYGAFMTVNLLAHTTLFKAGIARSGAYNRTLTPFGFQNEERTYWQDPKLYYDMSPFNFADKIKTPLLLVHGEMDDNPGTFPIQSERLYNAIKGHGGTVRYVVLPYEAHGYRGQENLLHLLYEENAWLEKYVKNAYKNDQAKTTGSKAF